MSRFKPQTQFPHLFGAASAAQAPAPLTPADLRLVQWCMRQVARRAGRRSPARQA